MMATDLCLDPILKNPLFCILDEWFPSKKFSFLDHVRPTCGEIYTQTYFWSEMEIQKWNSKVENSFDKCYMMQDFFQTK